jgi:hypothetical protein
MRKLLIVAAASMLCAVPAVAQQPESGSSISGEHMHRSFGDTKGDLGERLGEHKAYGYERDNDMRDRHGDGEEWRSHRGEDMGMGMHMREGCKYITVRQRQGDEIIVRHFRRCD